MNELAFLVSSFSSLHDVEFAGHRQDTEEVNIVLRTVAKIDTHIDTAQL